MVSRLGLGIKLEAEAFVARTKNSAAQEAFAAFLEKRGFKRMALLCKREREQRRHLMVARRMN
jgi:hypothetical protein